MTKTLIAVFRSWSDAESAVNALKSRGFDEDAIHVMPGNKFLDEVRAKREGGFLQSLKEKIGLGDYPTDVKSEDTVLVLDSDEKNVDLASEILDQQGAANIHTAGAPLSGGAAERSSRQVPAEMAGEEHGKAIPVVEEELVVGKRAERSGGVRVTSHVTEKPVEEQVKLRKERVKVERRPVNRPLAEGELAGMGEENIEVTATSEEPVIGKRARVKEEVLVSKEAAEESATIHETLRSTEIEVEHLSPEEETEFASEEEELRGDAGIAGVGYDEFRPYYRYGYHLGHVSDYRSGDWSDVEPRIRDDWEAHNYGPWDRYKDAVRRGWERSVHHSH